VITESSIEQLLNIVAIEDVVADYITTKRSGSRYKANCPFHDEKTASFTITPAMGIYKCFGCQKAGNAIGFLMEINQMSLILS
jgi:DNA primase